MARFVLGRVLLAVPVLLGVTFVSFMIIHLPPGDYVTSYIASMSASFARRWKGCSPVAMRGYGGASDVPAGVG